MNILIAEDNQDDVVYITRALQKASIKDTVHFVKDGEEAIEYLHGDGAYVDRESHPLPWITILDIQMPRKTGFETLAWMRLRPGYKDIPVMILSSSGLEQDMALAFKYGANAYVKKPDNAADLASELRRFYNFWRPCAARNNTSA